MFNDNKDLIDINIFLKHKINEFYLLVID